MALVWKGLREDMAVDMKEINEELMKDHSVVDKFITETEGKGQKQLGYDPVQRVMYLKSFWLGRVWLKIKSWFKK